MILEDARLRGWGYLFYAITATALRAATTVLVLGLTLGLLIGTC